MADDISNKTLAALLAVAVVVSLGGTLIVLKSGPSMTGLSTDIETGTAQVTITGTASMNIIDAVIDFGSGRVFDNSTSCTIDSGAPGVAGNTCPLNGTWAAITDEITLRNVGNSDLSVALSNGDPAATFIGGTGPSYKYNSSNSDASPGCVAGLVSAWTDVSSGGNICTNLTYGSSRAGGYEVDFDLQVVIPKDAPPGAKTDSLTFTGTSI